MHAVRHACATAGELQLLVLGRGAKEAEPLLRDGLAGSGVRLRVEGLCSEREISVRLAASDVLLFVRGGAFQPARQRLGGDRLWIANRGLPGH